MMASELNALQSEAGYIDARPLTANSTKTSCNARLDHTYGSEPDPCDRSNKWPSSITSSAYEDE